MNGSWIFLFFVVTFWALIIYIIVQVINDLSKLAGAGIDRTFDHFENKKRQLTNQHYYDREDVYLDYTSNQWYYKPGYPKEAT